MRSFALPLLLAVAACGSVGEAAMSQSKLQTCAPSAATLTLVEESLLTRTAITAATAGTYAKPVTLAPGDPRLARLGELLKGLAVTPAKLTQFEPRTFVELTCADGSKLPFQASATEDDGTVHLKIGDEIAATKAPLRRELAAILAQ